MRKRETPEERAARQQIADLEKKAEHEKYIGGLPARMHEAKKKILQLGGTAEIDIKDNNFVLVVRYDNKETGCCIETTVGYKSDIWEMEELESQIAYEYRLREERAARIALAQQVFDRLTKGEKDALSENFHIIRRLY